MVVPLGGGGLAGGIALAAGEVLPRRRIVGVQAEACAPYIDSLAAHRPVGARSANTICDGIAVKRPGDFTLPIVERHVDEVVTVSDDQVAEAMVLLLERSKLVVEGAGAVAVAALMHGRVEARRGGVVCAVLSGGNVDASLLSECIRVGETAAGRRMVLSTVVPDRPGALAGLLRVVADCGANVVDVEHLRDGIDLHVRETAIKLVLQTRGAESNRELLDAARAEGFSVRVEKERLRPTGHEDRPGGGGRARGGRPVVALESTIIATACRVRATSRWPARSRRAVRSGGRGAGDGRAWWTARSGSGSTTTRSRTSLARRRRKCGVRELAVVVAARRRRRHDGRLHRASRGARRDPGLRHGRARRGPPRRARQLGRVGRPRDARAHRVVVVCAGVKSILDVAATLERLETLNVAVLGYRTDRFPGFYLDRLRPSGAVAGALAGGGRRGRRGAGRARDRRPGASWLRTRSRLTNS